MSRAQKKNFLVFSPHPDDLDFGCAGTIAALTKKGHAVSYCIVTNGEKGVHKVHQSIRTMVRMRETEQRAAGSMVGVSHIIFLRLKDGDLEHTKHARKLVTKIIRQEKPDIVLSFDPANQRFDSFGRFHRDHRITAEIVFDALYPGVGSPAFFPELAQEDALPHKIEEVWFYGTDQPNHYINITRTIDKKIKALCQHESQIKDTRATTERIYARARKEGARKKMRYAEAFRRLTFS